MEVTCNRKCACDSLCLYLLPPLVSHLAMISHQMFSNFINTIYKCILMVSISLTLLERNRYSRNITPCNSSKVSTSDIDRRLKTNPTCISISISISVKVK